MQNTNMSMKVAKNVATSWNYRMREWELGRTEQTSHNYAHIRIGKPMDEVILGLYWHHVTNHAKWLSYKSDNQQITQK
jgi:hypothetical protein